MLDTFLATRPGLTAEELGALVRIDLRERRRRGETVDSRHYLVRFPAIADAPELAVDVIYAEYMVREEQGELVAPQEFEERFPEYRDLLADQLSLHEAFANPTSDTGHASSSVDSMSIAESQALPEQLEADYEILDVLGRGGMGVVYKARQQALNRLVALKMVRRADLENDELLARFRAEAEVVASLHHPQIVQVYDYGEHDGAPYLALELIEGGSLAERLDGSPWNPRRAAALIEEVARAVHFAHERGVVHRDLKPNNLLISGDGEPLQLKIADFGLAKVFRDDSVSHTQTGALLGTPSYMAPEQAYGRASAVGPAADVYALGAILYELLSGRPPYRGETAIDALQQLLLAEPVSIYRLVPGLPRDLATICSKCLERAERRYPSALELAEDLQRYLADRPIRARRIAGWERSWRWCRRNPALAAALGSVAALLLTVTAVSTWYSGKLNRQLAITQHAELAERKANDDAQLRLWDAYLAEISARNSSRQMGQRFAALKTVERAQELLPVIGTNEQRLLQLRNAVITSVSLPDMAPVRTIWKSSQAIDNGAIDLSADRFACTLQGMSVAIGRLSDGMILGRATHGQQSAGLQLGPDARFVGVSGDRGVQMWEVAESGLELAWHRPDAYGLSYTPDGRYGFVNLQAGGLTMLDVRSGKAIRQLSSQPMISPVACHSTSDRAAFCTADGLQIVELHTGKLLTKLPNVTNAAPIVAWHPSGDYLAAWGEPGITLWNVRTRKQIAVFPHMGFPHKLEFSSDGARLVSCSLWDARLILWDTGTGHKELDVQAFDSLAIDHRSDGRLALCKRAGQSIELWDLAHGSECRYLPRNLFPALGATQGAVVSADSRLLVLSGSDGLELWDLERCERLATQHGRLCSALFDQQGDLIVAWDSGIFRWPRRDSARSRSDGRGTMKVISLGPPEKLAAIGMPTSLAAGTPSEHLIYEEGDQWHALSMATGQRVDFLPPDDPRISAISSDSRFAAVAGWNLGGLTIWDVTHGTCLAKLATGKYGVPKFSPDDQWLATSTNGVQLWRTTDWTLAHELNAQGTTPHGLGVAFSADSRMLAIGEPNGEVRFIDAGSGRDVARIMHPVPQSSAHLCFTRDHRHLIALPADGQAPARLWNLVELREALRHYQLDWPPDVLAMDAVTPADSVPLEVKWLDGGWLSTSAAEREADR